MTFSSFFLHQQSKKTIFANWPSTPWPEGNVGSSTPATCELKDMTEKQETDSVSWIESSFGWANCLTNKGLIVSSIDLLSAVTKQLSNFHLAILYIF